MMNYFKNLIYILSVLVIGTGLSIAKTIIINPYTFASVGGGGGGSLAIYPYAISADWDASGNEGWTNSGTGTVDTAYTPALDGSESIRLSTTSAFQRMFIALPSVPQTSGTLCAQIKFLSLPSNYTEVLSVWDDQYSTTGAAGIRYFDGHLYATTGGGEGHGTFTITTNVTYYIWLVYSTGIAGAGSASFYISTTPSRPALPDGTCSNAIGTTGGHMVALGNTNSGNIDTVYDHIRFINGADGPVTGWPVDQILVVTDNFDSYGSGDALHSTSVWDSTFDFPFINKPAADGRVAGSTFSMVHSTSTFSSNQRSEATLDGTITSSEFVCVGVRCFPTDTRYWFQSDGSIWYLVDRQTGTQNVIATGTHTTIVAGDKIRLSVRGAGSATRLTGEIYYSGTWHAVSGATNVDPGSGHYIDGGSPGIGSSGITAVADDFFGYNL